MDFEKKWESNLLNLTTKESNDNNYKKKDSQIKIKKNFFINDSFLTTNTNKDNTYIKNTYNTTLNSTKNISNKSKHLKMNSSDLLYNKMKNKNKNKNKYENSKNLKKQNKNNSTTMINTSSVSNINKKNLPKNNKGSNSSLKENKNVKSKNHISINNENSIRNYYGPVNISLINTKKKEELEDEIILKMVKQGFECKKMNNFIKCHKKGKTIEIEIVKIMGNLLYYLTKIFNTK